MISTLIPYLNFNGNCREAMEFYKSVLGGELDMQTFGSTYGEKAGEEKDKIMHAHLKNEALSFMASDGPPGQEIKFGDNISLSIVGDNDELITNYFNGLAVGGKINMPLEKQIWGDKFGLLTDKFGVQWMVNISPQKSQA